MGLPLIMYFEQNVRTRTAPHITYWSNTYDPLRNTHNVLIDNVWPIMCGSKTYSTITLCTHSTIKHVLKMQLKEVANSETVPERAFGHKKR